MVQVERDIAGYRSNGSGVAAAVEEDGAVAGPVCLVVPARDVGVVPAEQVCGDGRRNGGAAHGANEGPLGDGVVDPVALAVGTCSSVVRGPRVGVGEVDRVGAVPAFEHLADAGKVVAGGGDVRGQLGVGVEHAVAVLPDCCCAADRPASAFGVGADRGPGAVPKGVVPPVVGAADEHELANVAGVSGAPTLLHAGCVHAAGEGSH